MKDNRRVVREGVLLGGLAYVAVAAFYALFDFLAARGGLYTVDLLGKALFRGLRDPAVLQLPMEVDFTAVFLYNGLHLVASVGIGLVIAWLIDRAETGPVAARLVVATLVAGFVVTVAVVGALTAPFRALLPWWSIVGANLSAVVVAGGALVSERPEALGILSGKVSSPGAS